MPCRGIKKVLDSLWWKLITLLAGGATVLINTNICIVTDKQTNLVEPIVSFKQGIIHNCEFTLVRCSPARGITSLLSAKGQNNETNGNEEKTPQQV